MIFGSCGCPLIPSGAYTLWPAPTSSALGLSFTTFEMYASALFEAREAT
jgi:hypothetical protein